MVSARTELFALSLLLQLLLLSGRGDAKHQVDEVQVLKDFQASCFIPNITGVFTVDTSIYWATWDETDRHPCSWVGVTCTARYTVEQLVLSGWGLYVVPNFTLLASLRDLRHLDLSSNNFWMDGTIPDAVGNLTELTWLDLSQSLFVGGIPANLAHCRQLRYLSLAKNSLQGQIPLSSLLNLQVLSLADNLFTGSFPEALGEMSGLVSVDLSGNTFNGGIPSLRKLVNLLQLKLDGNSFLSFEEPQSPIATSMKELSVSGNQLEGEFPLGLTFMPNLEVLNMSNNSITGAIPSGWNIQLNHSFQLDLSLNLLTGKIPAELLLANPKGDFGSVNLSYNNLSGNIPIADGAVSFYDVLDLSHNQLSGPLPWDSGFSDIGYLWLHNNKLNGDVVDALRRGPILPSSIEVRLQNNLFVGDLSKLATNWSQADVLKVVDLSDNSLQMSTTDVVPDPLGSTLESISAADITEFRMARNKFSGTSLPSGDTCYTNENLQVLDISGNHLQGEISSKFFSDKCTQSLQILNLSNNEISGPIPPSILAWPQLVILNVSNNNLSGPLPFITPSSTLYNPSLFLGNALCGNPLAPCPTTTVQIANNVVQWWVYFVIVLSVIIALGSFLTAIWRLRVYHKRHQQDADLIQTLVERETATLMPLRDLKKATDNFAESAQIGEGGFGTVYTGNLIDGTKVAIKRSKREGSEKDKQQFLNEVRILSQVHHRNLVKLLGCCMENKVALLVFEFVSNGTLHEHLCGKIGDGSTRLSWKQRLNIAVQTADALNYLHTAATFPIFHRDVKSANILLDNDCNAKVADFGISKLAPVEATHVSTIAIQGTMGYIDPEYYTSYQLTGKSDVYSFGVVLLELISAKPVIDFQRGEDETSLVNFADPLIESGDLQRFIDPALVETYSDSFGRQSVLNVGRLAKQCLNLRSKARPSMNEVLIELLTLWHELVGSYKQNSGVLDVYYSQDRSRDHADHLSESFSGRSSSMLRTDSGSLQMSQFSQEFS